MKRYYIISAVVLGFFGLLFGALNTISTGPDKRSSKAKLQRDLVGEIDGSETSRIQVKGESSPKAPIWGAIKTQVAPKPKADNMTFAGTTSPKADSKKAETKKKDKKKVAKKKKKKDAPKVAKKSRAKKTAENETTSDSSDWNAAYPASGLFGEQKKKDPKALPETMEEWEEFVLNPPNLDRLMIFIKYYHARVVADPVFYGLNEKMLISKSEKVRRFGILALGATPSPRSFALLTHASEAERSSALVSLIDTNYQTYQSLSYLQIMYSSLQDQEDVVRYYAAVTIGKSAMMHIRSTSTPGPTSSRGGRQPTGNPTVNRHYQGFVSMLENLASNDPSAMVQSEARRTLQIIRDLSRPAGIVASN